MDLVVPGRFADLARHALRCALRDVEDVAQDMGVCDPPAQLGHVGEFAVAVAAEVGDVGHYGGGERAWDDAALGFDGLEVVDEALGGEGEVKDGGGGEGGQFYV